MLLNLYVLSSEVPGMVLANGEGIHGDTRAVMCTASTKYPIHGRPTQHPCINTPTSHLVVVTCYHFVGSPFTPPLVLLLLAANPSFPTHHIKGSPQSPKPPSPMETPVFGHRSPGRSQHLQAATAGMALAMRGTSTSGRRSRVFTT